jgi:hypothetical protein
MHSTLHSKCPNHITTIANKQDNLKYLNVYINNFLDVYFTPGQEFFSSS